MEFADAAARRIFFAYALPCLEVHVSKTKLGKTESRKIIHDYGSGQELSDDVERYFPRAIERCSRTAKRLGKSAIDADAVRRCFRFEHDKYVDEEAAENMIRNPDYCKTWPGIVIGIVHHTKGPQAMVKTPRWSKEYRMELVPGAKKDDYVVVHRSFISEKIDRNMAEEILKAKGIEISCMGV